MDPTKQAELFESIEIEMMSDLYDRLTNACYNKCIPSKYHDSDLTKGESVCIDRCVAKYMEIHEEVGKKLVAMQQQEAAGAKPS